MSITCPKCGRLNRNNAKTCALCGFELVNASFEEVFGPPKQLQGRYLIRQPLSQSLGTSVYEATDRQNDNRPCHIYEITTAYQDPLDREDLEERFLLEATAWQALQHPNIARVFDAFSRHSRLYLVTEAVEGTSLLEVAQDRRQTPSEATLLHWARQLAEVLDYLHNQTPPMILGSLTAASIRVDPAGDIKLVDLGLSRYSQSRAGDSRTTRGVPGYEAPEQRQGQLLPQSDIYSLGILLYTVVTHHDPTERPLPALRNLAPQLSEAVTRVIAQAYRRDPARRYATAAEMRQAVVELGEPVALKVALPPFVLAEDQQATTLRDLVRLCASHWDDGLRALVGGRIAAWLEEAAASLRAAGRPTEADEIAGAARRTIQAREKMIQTATQPGMEEIAHHAAYAAWLDEMGAVGIRPRLDVSPRGFDFGQIPPTKKAIARLHIHNKGQGFLTGRIESPFPWLAVPRPFFGCRGGQTAEVSVVARGRRLPAGVTHSPQAILITSNGGQAWLEARAESSEPVLAVQTARLDFGPITPGSSHIAHLSLSNQGGGLLSGSVHSRLPWLRVRRPEFRCPAGASARIPIELIGGQMPPEAIDAARVQRALVVDSDTAQATVDIAWQWARPGLALDTTALDFGAARRPARITRSVTLSNPGTAELVGRATSQVNWLQVQPAEFSCPPGSQQTLRLVADTANLPGGDTLVAEAVMIQANAGRQALTAAVEVLAPELVVEPAFVELGTVQDGDDVEVAITVSNRGSVSWEGQAHSTLPWLSVEPEMLLIEPGHSVLLTAILDTTALETGGEWTIADALHIAGQGEQRNVGAHVVLARPQLAVGRTRLDFGIIGRQEIATLPLEIHNTGNGQLAWQIEWPTKGKEAWLEAIPVSGRCGPGQRVSVQVRAFALAVEGKAGQAWLTVHSNAGRADLPASVALSAPRLAVDPPSLDFDSSENYAAVARTLRVANKGVGRLEGAITSCVPWLTVEPTVFANESGAATLIDIVAQPQGLREGRHDVTAALKIESNGGAETIDARIEIVLRPCLHVEVESLHFARNQPEKQGVRLENQGYSVLRLQVVPSASWITINRQEWTIKEGKKGRLEIGVDLDEAPPGSSGAVEIWAGDQVTRIAVEVD
ncbi:MAG: BACON domain-containing protein [Chloroflexota bacterium]